MRATDTALHSPSPEPPRPGTHRRPQPGKAPDPPEDGGRRRSVMQGGLWSAASQVVPAFGTAVLSVAAGRLLGSGPLGQQSLIAYVNSAASSVVLVSLNIALLQLGGSLQGRGDVGRLRHLTRWAIGSHLAAGVVVMAAMVATGQVLGHNQLAWAVIGGVVILDAGADGLSVRLILIEGWGPIGRLRLVFQMLGPFFGIALLVAGFGITGIFLGDGLAALGLLIATVRRFRRLDVDSTRYGTRTPVRPSVADSAELSEAGEPTNASAPLAIGVPTALQDEPAPRAVSRSSSRAASRRAGRRGWRPPLPVARLFGLFAVGSLINQVVSKRVEFIVLAAYSGDVAVGMYSVAFMAVSLISMIPQGVATAAMPMIAAADGRGESDAATRHLRYALRLGTVVMIPLAAVLAAIGPTAVVFVYGRAYDDAARLVPLASAALLVAVVSGVTTQFWSGRARLGIVLRTGAFASVVDLGVALLAVPHLGALGAVLANLAGQAALAGSLLVATVRASGPIGWRFGSLARAAVAGLAGADAILLVRLAVATALPGGEIATGLTLVVGGLLGLAVAGGVALLVPILEPDEADWLRPLVPARLGRLLDGVTRAPRPVASGSHAEPATPHR